MKLANGLILELRNQSDKVVLTQTDEYGPSLMGGGLDVIHIPKSDLPALIEMLKLCCTC